jgi:hypothetical protein
LSFLIDDSNVLLHNVPTDQQITQVDKLDCEPGILSSEGCDQHGGAHKISIGLPIYRGLSYDQNAGNERTDIAVLCN